MLRLRCSGIVLALIFGGATLSGDQVFFAREFLYTNEFRMGFDLFPEGTSMALSPRGIYVSGTFNPPSSAPQTGGFPEPQAFIRRYDAMGFDQWTRQIPEATVAFPSLSAADASSLYVAGALGFGRTDLFLRKYDETGNELWSRKIRISENAYHVATGLAVDASGIYVAGGTSPSQGILRKYSPAGDELWSQTINAFHVGAVAADGRGVYVAGWTDGTSGVIRKYAAGGSELWTRKIDAGQVCACKTPPGAVAADSTGVYVAGAVLIKVDPGGDVQWKRAFTGPLRIGPVSSIPAYYVGAAAVDETGLYVAGETEFALPDQCKAGSGDVFVRKYDQAGNEQWTRQFGSSGREFLGGVAADSTGVYVSGGIRGGPMHGTVFLTKLRATQMAAPEGRPHIWRECVVNAASYVGGGVAPGEIVAVFGQAMGPAELTQRRVGQDGRLATVLADTRVLFNGIPAPLLYVSATQSSAIVPYQSATGGEVAVEIEYRGVRSEPLTLPVAASRPGVFTSDGSGYGQAAILNSDASLNSAANPAERGSVIVVYLTGEGLTNPAGEDGAITGAFPPKPRLPVSVWFEDPVTADGESAEVLYAGAVSGSVAGLLQINIRVPAWARSGSSVPFYVQIGAGTAEAGFTAALR